MKRLWLILFFFLASLPLAADSWQYGRIVEVRKSATTNVKAWVVNTPITEDQVTYTISVHIGDKILTGNYEPTSEQSPPPEEWTTNYPVKVLIAGDSMSVRGPTGDIRLHISKRKSAKLMSPLTADEKKGLEQIEAPAQSLIGFQQDSKTERAAEPAPAPQPPPQPLNVGTVTVRSTPYLSEVFVDGDSMGYTPAKINLAPGKHTFRVEKPGYRAWTKEMMITVGSELTLDATLDRR
jgi:hypothetical protein